jgi:hypothetical protein
MGGVPMVVKVLTGFTGQELYTFPNTVGAGQVDAVGAVDRSLMSVRIGVAGGPSLAAGALAQPERLFRHRLHRTGRGARRRCQPCGAAHVHPHHFQYVLLCHERTTNGLIETVGSRRLDPLQWPQEALFVWFRQIGFAKRCVRRW